jgi:hypothetical protein
MNSEGEEEEEQKWDDLSEDVEVVSNTPASVPSWAQSQPRSNRSINTFEREQRARLRKLTLGDTFEDKLKKLLETLVNQKSNNDRGSRNLKLTNIVCDKWSGDKRLTAKQYRAWKKKVKGIAKYYELTDQQTAFLIQFNCTGVAKEALDIFEPDDLEDPDILNQIWAILDGQHEQLAHVRTDEAYKAWEQAHRKHGETMHQWINNLKKIKMELEAQDNEVVISKRMYASKLMRGSGLSSRERAQVIINAGGNYEYDKLTNVLLYMHADVHDTDHKKGRVFPVKVKTKRTTFRKTRYSTHQADVADDERSEGVV